MEETKQIKFRSELEEKYLLLAFESCGLYEYYGKQYQAIEKQVMDLEARKNEASKMAQDINAKPKAEVKPADRMRVRDLREDVRKYEKQIESVKEIMQKVFQKSSGYQNEAGQFFEKAGMFKTFTLKTPEQIEADKKKPVDQKQTEQEKTS